MSTYLSEYIENVKRSQMQKPIQISDVNRIFLKNARGNIAFNGFSNEYEIHYPQVLQKYNVDKEDLIEIIEDINVTASKYWPCMNCFYCGTVLSVFTCCLSYIIPHICITEAQEFVQQEIDKYNKDYFYPKGLELELKKGCFKSWLQINILKYEEIVNANQIIQNLNQEF